MTVYQILGIASAVVFTIAYVPYIISIVKGDTKPHPFTWLLWSINAAAGFYFYVHVGASETLPFAFLNFALPIIVTCLSFKYWEKGFSVFDYACLSVSGLSIVTYIIFHVAAISLTLSLVADFVAYLPTIRKTYRDPSSESLSGWLLFLAGYLLAITAISTWTYGIAVYPIYFAVLGILMCMLIYRGRLKKAQ